MSERLWVHGRAVLRRNLMSESGSKIHMCTRWSKYKTHFIYSVEKTACDAERNSSFNQCLGLTDGKGGKKSSTAQIRFLCFTAK